MEKSRFFAVFEKNHVCFLQTKLWGPIHTLIQFIWRQYKFMKVKISRDFDNIICVVHGFSRIHGFCIFLRKSMKINDHEISRKMMKNANYIIEIARNFDFHEFILPLNASNKRVYGSPYLSLKKTDMIFFENRKKT